MLVAQQMPDPPLFGTNRGAPSTAASVFLKCRRCGTQNRIDGIPATRVDLARFRGSEERVKCRGCGAQMDTIGAYCAARIHGEIEPRPDPAR
jgi:hypothetical protein